MLSKNIVLVTLVVFVCIDGGLTQANKSLTLQGGNNTDVSDETDSSADVENKDYYGDYETDTNDTAKENEVIITTSGLTTTTDTSSMTPKITVSTEYYEDYETDTNDTAKENEVIITTSGLTTTTDTSSMTPKITVSTVASILEEEDAKNCFSLMRPTVFTLLVLALCCICLLFIYTVICSCVLAKRRIGDVESLNSTRPRENEKNTRSIEEQTKKKETADKKTKAEKRKQAKASKEKVKKEKTQQKEKIEKRQTSKEKKMAKGTGTVDTKMTTIPVVDTGKITLDTLQETREDKTTDNQTSGLEDISEIRISNIPPPPVDDEQYPSVAHTDVIIEALPPPPPPEDVEGKNQTEDTTVNETESNDKSDGVSSSATATEANPVKVVATEKNEEATLSESQDQTVDLTNVGMKLDEVLDMLNSINE